MLVVTHMYKRGHDFIKKCMGSERLGMECLQDKSLNFMYSRFYNSTYLEYCGYMSSIGSYSIELSSMPIFRKKWATKIPNHTFQLFPKLDITSHLKQCLILGISLMEASMNLLNLSKICFQVVMELYILCARSITNASIMFFSSSMTSNCTSILASTLSFIFFATMNWDFTIHDNSLKKILIFSLSSP